MSEVIKVINTELITTVRPEGLVIVVVGAGGTGARLLPGLIKTARGGTDEIHVVDHDIVEPRNLIRQNFNARDIGFHKAEVMAARYNTAEIPVFPHVVKMERGENYLLEEIYRASTERLYSVDRNRYDRSNSTGFGLLMISCVDTKEARRSIEEALGRFPDGTPVGWIDAGNDMRSGQVLISLKKWPRRNASFEFIGFYDLRGRDAMPQVFVGDEDQAEGCQALDTQTVTVNNMSACATLNAASWLMHGIPFGSVGSLFSTFNSMEPIPIEEITDGGYEGHKLIIPSKKFAIEGGSSL